MHSQILHTPSSHRPLRAVAIAVATACALSTVACQSNAVDAKPAPSHASASLQGLWQTDGYGTVVAVDSRRLRTYETTRISCLPGTLAAEQTGDTNADGVAFLPTDAADADGAARITMTPHGSGTALMRYADNAGTRTLHRIGQLPKRCGHQAADDPRTVFDVFWQTYAENYPAFKAKGIDWDAVRDRYRRTITAKTSDAGLFATLRRMIEPLHDAHTALVAGKDRRFVGHKKGTALPTPETMKKIEKATAKSVGVKQQTWGQGAISYADLPDRLGYLRITRFTNFTDTGHYADDVAELNKALDAVFTKQRTHGAGTLRGLVIDVRFNGGGSDPLGLRIASRLTDRAYTAYTKRARDGARGSDAFTAPEKIRVRPYTVGPVYTGPIAVLTGPLTVSAGETFTQALMGRALAPTRIGENTQGAFSDTMDRKLPGGWTFTLPSEQFLTDGGKSFEGTGIPPNARTPVFTDEEFNASRDSALTRAKELLRESPEDLKPRPGRPQHHVS